MPRRTKRRCAGKYHLRRRVSLQTAQGLSVQSPVSIQLTTIVNSVQSFQLRIKVTQNWSKACPVGSSAARSPLMAMMPTYNRSTNSSKEATSSVPEARQINPLWKYCLMTGFFQNFMDSPRRRSSSFSGPDIIESAEESASFVPEQVRDHSTRTMPAQETLTDMSTVAIA